MNCAKSISGFIAGVSIGAMAGILLAPDKGAATRKKITDHTNDLRSLLNDWMTEFIDSLKNSNDSFITAHEQAPDMKLNTMG